MMPNVSPLGIPPRNMLGMVFSPTVTNGYLVLILERYQINKRHQMQRVMIIWTEEN
jgi:hypothetical protein